MLEEDAKENYYAIFETQSYHSAQKRTSMLIDDRGEFMLKSLELPGLSVGTTKTITMQELTLTAITDTEKCTLM